ncbi:FtsX-like permease family protein [Desulfonatronum thioautotrophicum]|uniref:FtsX-like permease family protein n=1 Tax=Desulfonatronum thioautotrophicum TaxID=617001 RepID=UPI0005EBE0ED|nr:FtsX-like permease family protein [Desulfonatronum thioautotrophicum]
MPQPFRFLKFFLRFNLRHARGQWARTLAVLLGVAVGAAVFAGVRLAIDASSRNLTQGMDLIAGNADFVVTGQGGLVPARITAELLTDPAVYAAVPVLERILAVAHQPEVTIRLRGTDLILEDRLRRGGHAPLDISFTVLTDLLIQPRSLLLGQGAADRLGLSAGDTLTLIGPSGPQAFGIADLLPPRGLGRVEDGFIAVADIATVQEFLAGDSRGLMDGGVADRIDLRLSPGMNDLDREATLTRISPNLPAQTSLAPPDQRRESGMMLLSAYHESLTLISFVSLFVGMFLIYSLVSLNAAARRGEVAILRALGGPRWLPLGLFLGEGVLLAVLGLLAALPLALVFTPRAANLINRTIDDLFLRLPSQTLHLAPWEIGLTIGVTLVVAVLAALHPAWEAARASPREALAMLADTSSHGQNRRMTLSGIGCLLGAIPLFLLPPVLNSLWPAYCGVFLLFVGSALQTPWVLAAAARAMERTAGLRPAWFGPGIKLAGRSLRRAGPRTSIAVGALITALALYVALSVMIHSFRTTFLVWVDNTVSGDVFVTSANAEANEYRDAISLAAQEFILAQTAAQGGQVLPYRRAYLEGDGYPYQFETMDMAAFSTLGSFLFKHGDPDSALRVAAQGQGVIVSETWAVRRSVGIGDRFQAVIEGIRLDTPVVGIVRDYRTRGGVIYHDWDAFIALGGDPRWEGVRVYFPEADNPQAAAARFRAALAAHPAGQGLDVTTGVDLRNLVTDIFTQTFGITALLMGIALLVAGVGVATTLAVRVLERRKELNTLRALGGSRGQIRALIFWEAGIIGLVGAGLGLACGLILSVVFIEVINKQGFGWTFVFSVNWRELGLALPGLLAAALVAAVPATVLALRDPPAQALKER